MANRRLLLHDLLCGFIPKRWDGDKKKYVCDVYFQPPESVMMHYPAIVYGLNGIASGHADGRAYLSDRSYSVTVIDEDPDSPIVDEIAALPLCKWNRHYEKDNLNHDVFTLFF